jgi:hypothetical protein
VATLELDLDLGECLIDPKASLDQTVVDADHNEDQHDDDRDDDDDGEVHALLRSSRRPERAPYGSLAARATDPSAPAQDPMHDPPWPP